MEQRDEKKPEHKIFNENVNVNGSNVKHSDWHRAKKLRILQWDNSIA